MGLVEWTFDAPGITAREAGFMWLFAGVAIGAYFAQCMQLDKLRGQLSEHGIRLEDLRLR
jgi:hypothetical protein